MRSLIFKDEEGLILELPVSRMYTFKYVRIDNLSRKLLNYTASWSGFMVLVALATLKALQYNKEDRGYLPTVMLYAKVSDVYKYVGSLCYDYAYI
jgi:hypothetical protein